MPGTPVPSLLLPLPSTVAVFCSLNNGLRLNLGVRIYSTYSPALHDMEVLLRPGLNTIDRDWWCAWTEQHADSDLLAKRIVHEA